MNFHNGERSDPGGPSLSNSLQHCGGCSDKDGSAGSLWAAGNTEWFDMGGRISQHSVMCGQWPHSRSQPHVGTDDADGGGQNF